MMKLAAIIVVYEPVIKDLIENIESVIENSDKLIIFQNSLVIDQLKQYPKYQNIGNKEKIFFLGNGNNVGIGTALNKGIVWALDNKFTHILTLDQDSYFEMGHLYKYKTLIEGLSNNNIGVYGINPYTGNKLLFTNNENFIEVSDTITSGSIFPLSIFEKTGFFDEDLFIDAVDYEFCYRIKSRFNLKTIVFTNIILRHKVGYVTKTWLGFSTNNYSAFRTYFIVRNQIAIWLKFPEQFSTPYKLTLLKHHIFYRLIKILLGENDKYKKIKAILIGITHAFKARTGYYSIK